LVIGGGPAGSVCAALLAKQGRSVLLLESETFPRYHIGESLVTGIIPVLEAAGVDLQLIDREFRPKTGIFLVWGKDQEMWHTPFKMAKTAFDHSWHVERARFDQILLDNARAQGATVREGARVIRPVEEDGRVTGVVYRDGAGEHAVNARLTIDASGQSRVLARNYTDVQFRDDLKNIALWSYFDYDIHSEETEYDIVVEALKDRRWTWMIPIKDDSASVGVVMPIDRYTARREAGEAPLDIFLDSIRGTKVTKDMVRELESTLATQQLRTTRDWSHVSDRWFGPGWLVVGDSAAFIDPLFSFGVFLASSGAFLAARAADSFLDHGDERALRNYQATAGRLVDDMLIYVRYFYDSSRTSEDYMQRAAELAKAYASSSQVGFITLLAGVSRLPEVIDFEPMGEEGIAAAKDHVITAVAAEESVASGAS
jgi:flavin-dependent dehydrogenase